MGYMATALRLTADLWDYRSRQHDGLVLERGSGSRIDGKDWNQLLGNWDYRLMD